MREALRIKHREHLHRYGYDKDRVEKSQDAKDAKPRGPAAGSPERAAILDAIARGELNVEDAIKKLREEE